MMRRADGVRTSNPGIGTDLDLFSLSAGGAGTSDLWGRLFMYTHLHDPVGVSPFVWPGLCPHGEALKAEVSRRRARLDLFLVFRFFP